VAVTEAGTSGTDVSRVDVRLDKLVLKRLKRLKWLNWLEPSEPRTAR
jgi:hypothetical protein